MNRIYLDHNATTPPHPEVVESMLPYLKATYGNPSSLHWFGQQARRGLDRAREQVAALIGARPDEIVFCSGGTEANNYALMGAVSQSSFHVPHVIISAVEHQSIMNPCRELAQGGCFATNQPVNAQGAVVPDCLAENISGRTALVSVMLANNDVGTVQPIPDIAWIARSRGVLIHTDAVQGLGRIPVDVTALNVDLLSMSGHKLHGPKGIGALYVRRGVDLAPWLLGGSQERHLRAGTENLPGIVGLGTACDLARDRLVADAKTTRDLRDRLEAGLKAALPGLRINGHPLRRLPNTLNVTVPGLSAEELVMTLDALGIAASTGSACAAGEPEPSYVLTAMGLSEADALSSVRFSLGPDNTEAEIDQTIQSMVEVTDTMTDATADATPKAMPKAATNP